MLEALLLEYVTCFRVFHTCFTCVLPVHDQSMEAELQTRFGLPDGLSDGYSLRRGDTLRSLLWGNHSDTVGVRVDF